MRWVQAADERDIVDHLFRCAIDADSGVPAFIDAHPGPLILFDAACPGPEIEDDKLTIPLHPGRYVVGAVEYSPNSEIELVVVQFTKVD